MDVFSESSKDLVDEQAMLMDTILGEVESSLDIASISLQAILVLQILEQCESLV